MTAVAMVSALKEHSMAARPIGFVGLGNMGGRMTRRLVAAGLSVLGFDVRADVVSASGASPAASLGQIADGCDLILLSLPDSHAVEAVVEGPAGLMAHCRAGQTIVDLSTAAPRSTRQLAASFADRGVVFVDAGISGGAAAAEKGTLTLMIGGPAGVDSQLEPVFRHIAAKVVHMGPSGNGHATKLLNNFLNAVTLAATAEVMVAGRKAGLDLQLLLDVINSSSGVSFASLNRFPHIIRGNYLEGGLTGKLMTKDIVLYAELAGELGVASLNTAGPLASFGLATALGYGDQISNRVVDAIGDASGGVRVNS
jgi:3-hydroxyisobutyrate dehydrogenase-like beta-hydroxyacid dehydrogenase